MEIQKNPTTVNRTKMSNKVNKYLVIHYTANNGDTAYGNTKYFKSVDRKASANYFVDDTSVWQCVLDSDASWHCGGKLQGSGGHSFFGICKNSNSIGIEMCSRIVNGKYVITDATIANTVWLCKQLTKKYNISIDRVIRHYDVTGKICPEPMVRNPDLWQNFKNMIISENSQPVQKHWADDMLDELINRKILSDRSQWENYTYYTTKGMYMVAIDNATGGRWDSEESNSSIHWAQPSLISLMGKKKITDRDQWSDYDSVITKALAMALLDNSTDNMQGTSTDGIIPKYNDPYYDGNHWCMRHLNSLCDKGIITDVSQWENHWDDGLKRSDCIALLYKAYCK